MAGGKLTAVRQDPPFREPQPRSVSAYHRYGLTFEPDAQGLASTGVQLESNHMSTDTDQHLREGLLPRRRRARGRRDGPRPGRQRASPNRQRAGANPMTWSWVGPVIAATAVVCGRTRRTITVQIVIR